MEAEAEEESVVGSERRLNPSSHGNGVVRVNCCQRPRHIEEAKRGRGE